MKDFQQLSETPRLSTPSQVRLKPGDLCQLCLQATAPARRRFWQQPGRPDLTATSTEICGVNEAGFMMADWGAVHPKK